ncbi:MAG: hypothetical protein CL973_00835 [Euryarchaeota archaeon]|jgi:hypothetical protein|nr:hypothetical protein [Euryarchaeota archaeon]
MSNYTPAMVAAIEAAAPLNLDKAKALAADFGLSHRSVISKAKSLEVEYVAQVRTAAKRDSVTKNDILRGIREGLSLGDREGDLTKAELVTILEHIG